MGMLMKDGKIEKKILDLPFYKNDKTGLQCYQVAMEVPLKHFLNKDFTLDDLDKLTGRKGAFCTYTAQVAPALYDLGLDVKYYSPVDPSPQLGGEKYIREHFGKEAEEYLRLTDMDAMMGAVRNLLKYDIFEKKKLSLEEICEHIANGHVVIALIDYYKLIGKEGGYQGHVVVLTGFDKENIDLHQPGPGSPQANMKVTKERFMDSWNALGTDNDLIIVSGKRK